MQRAGSESQDASADKGPLDFLTAKASKDTGQQSSRVEDLAIEWRKKMTVWLFLLHRLSYTGNKSKGSVG